MRPEPNGQMPAIARNSVDLPEPDGPVTSTRSPGAIVMPSASTSGTPFGSRTARSVEADRVLASPGVTAITGGVAASARAAATDVVEAGEPLDHRAPFGESR